MTSNHGTFWAKSFWGAVLRDVTAAKTEYFARFSFYRSLSVL
jgi:hypothetical protein